MSEFETPVEYPTSPEIEEKQENMFTGIIGAVLGAVIGGASIVLLGQLGYVASITEAFDTWLHPKFGYFKEPKRLDVYETLAFLRSIGAVPVLAHPFLNLKTPELLEGFLPGAIEAGLQGMETRYSKFSPEETARACAIADRFGLLHSGGSDFHGSNKPDIRLGVGKGDLRVPGELLRKLERKYKENLSKR